MLLRRRAATQLATSCSCPRPAARRHTSRGTMLLLDPAAPAGHHELLHGAGAGASVSLDVPVSSAAGSLHLLPAEKSFNRITPSRWGSSSGAGQYKVS